ncbi:hypothetical protein FACS1894211_07520 [Clostridia bacterium]|nr:hypothetical protein FACS1894211_07520 [Clostridia bacterium]
MLVPENALVPAPVPETPPFGTRAGESASKNDGPRQNPNDIDLGADSPAEINPRVGTETVRQAALTKGEILDVLCKMDIRVAALNIEIAERSEDGSAAVLKVGGRDVGARGFADALNLADARITDIRAENGAYVISYTVG